ncbi:MAG: alpha/beta hydrolase-fold protein [Kofleriaceae bacterium]|nr:alpha/beta hydrolase-fold protein [Kofleriaceae bacterium]
MSGSCKGTRENVDDLRAPACNRSARRVSARVRESCESSARSTAQRDVVAGSAGAHRLPAAPTSFARSCATSELKPQIAARYRVTSEIAIIGESAAGLFVLETLLVEPSLFDAYIAVDPSVWWNQQALVTEFARD